MESKKEKNGPKQGTAYHPTSIGKIDLGPYMQNNYRRKVTLSVFAKETGRSLSTFHRDFKSTFQQTPHRWIMAKRLEYARKHLKTTKRKISEIYFEAGFVDFTHFSKAFRKKYGLSPSAYRQLIGAGLDGD